MEPKEEEPSSEFCSTLSFLSLYPNSYYEIIAGDVDYIRNLALVSWKRPLMSFSQSQNVNVYFGFGFYTSSNDSKDEALIAPIDYTQEP